MKPTLFTRLIQSFYGFNGSLDEYQLQSINELGNLGFMLSWTATLIILVIRYMLSGSDEDILTMTTILLLAVNIFLIPIIILFKADRKGLFLMNMSEKNYVQQVRKIRSTSFIMGIGTAIGSTYGAIQYFAKEAHTELMAQLFEPHVVINFIIAFSISGGLCYFILNRRLKKSIKQSLLNEE